MTSGQSISARQQQVLDILRTWQRAASDPELSREMKRRHGMNYPVNDLMGALHRKGLVRQVDSPVRRTKEWELVS